ncbi:MAG: aspartyl protease family protein, partial [Kangiellaceae bacterium]|nr:aspartyl protease family protein [Kangiellaceae bacterium]
GVVSQALYDSMDIKQSPINEVEVQGAMHSNAMKVTQLSNAGVAGAKADGLDFVISPRDIIPNIEALLGSEFLCSFLVEFNFKTNQLILHPKSNKIEQHTDDKDLIWGKADFSNKLIRGAITMDMTLESKPVVAVLDTGARHSIMNWNAANLIGVGKDSPRVKAEKNTAQGIHGNAPDTSYKVQLDSLSLAGENRIVQKDMTMRVADLGSFQALVGNKPAINLGVDFFNQRRLLIDYSNQQIAISE